MEHGIEKIHDSIKAGVEINCTTENTE